MAHGDVGEEGGREVEAFCRELAGGLVEIRALGDSAGDELADAVELGLRVDGTDVGVLVERVAGAEGFEADLEFGQNFFGDGFLNEQPRSGAADVALVEEDAVDDALDGLVERGVFEDDVSRFAAEFEGEALGGSGERALDGFANFGGAGEGDLRGERVVDHGGSGLARAGDDVDDTRWQSGIL